MRTPITLDIAETVIRDLVQNLEPRRIKIEDILRIISRHYGVSKGDLLSQRRHRSVVWPRQIGMYLAKHLTARSLPEIGRRFGGAITRPFSMRSARSKAKSERIRTSGTSLRS